ncbi:pentatricopeptide repeat-containing protein-like [Dorcoceras hygrometricum]|uniref:Pentatricopeptide repeat-containing protein-like n=1 Tax=Dorcoceras hygrometricum TaxID=472368 RepID=A0A2Z7D3J8_9LAMI|nr:pentatricopeptide repeat-containing protein-like [Dorcoceras hygrometricum]
MLSNYGFRPSTGRSLCNAWSVLRCLSVEAISLFRWNSEITSCFKKHDVTSARELFETMPCKNAVTWNCMISGYIINGMINEAREFFDSMPTKNVVSWTSMLNGYAKNGKLEEARRLFDAVENKNAICWNCMISGYVRNGKLDEARMLFGAMQVKNDVSYSIMVEGYFRYGFVSEAERLFDEASTKMSWNLMLRGYLQQDNITGASKFFHRIPRKDETTWNTLISGYQGEEALILYTQMLTAGFKPDQSTLSSVISVCGSLAIQGWGKGMHVFVFKIGYENDCIVMSSLVSMYSQCGFIVDATLVFQTIETRDTVAWNAIIMAVAHHYSATNALDLFTHMIHSGCHPDHATFLILLTACAHAGLVNEGWNYLKSMEGWNLSPKPEHYASMVDLLGRSGLLAEAFDLVDQLPVNLPAYALETLLCACRIHENYGFSDLIAKKILSYQPHDVGICVLQSNLYSARGLWKDAARVRANLKLNKLKKELGCSWIDINGSVPCFSYYDKSHI